MITSQSMQKIEIQNNHRTFYLKVNAYSHGVCVQQIQTLIIFLIILILYHISIFRGIICLNQPIFLVLIGFHFMLLLILGYDYVYLTCYDPVDPLVIQRKSTKSASSLKQCRLCNCYVHRSSHHCMKCNRCTFQMDHHCYYLNNCIGAYNYQAFFRILIMMTLYLFNLIGQGIRIFIAIQAGNNLQVCVISRWLVLALMILIFILLIPIILLLGFHVYLSIFLKITTIQYIFRQLDQKSDHNQNVIVEPNLSNL